jgi:hypothetical protein
MAGGMTMRRWLAVLLAVMALCGCAGAEGAFSGASYDAGLAVVGGEVYCAAPNVGLGFIPIWRVDTRGLERVRSRIGGWSALYALGDELLTVEPVLNLGEMLGSIPMSTHKAGRLDPTKGKYRSLETYTWNKETGVCNVFAAQGRAYRDVREGDAHVLQRLDDGEWTTVAQWTGDHAWVYETFCIIGDRNADKPRYVALYDFSAGQIHDVTALDRKYALTGSSLKAVLENGVLYLLKDNGLTALNLSTGQAERLVSLPEEMNSFILAPEQLILLSSTRQQAWVLDRRCWEIVSTVSMTEYPHCAALVDGKLYVYSSYSDAGVEIIDLVKGESVHYPLQ